MALAAGGLGEVSLLVFASLSFSGLALLVLRMIKNLALTEKVMSREWGKRLSTLMLYAFFTFIMLALIMGGLAMGIVL